MKVYGIFGETLEGKQITDMIPYQSIKQARTMFIVDSVYNETLGSKNKLFLFRNPYDLKPRYELRWKQRAS